jgi:hypothetical protein
MRRKLPGVNPLQLRKELLIAESELNRAQLVGDMSALTVEVHALTSRAKSLGLIAASGVALVAGLASFKRGKAVDAAAKSSWLPSLLKGAGQISTLWAAFRTPGNERKGQ